MIIFATCTLKQSGPSYSLLSLTLTLKFLIILKSPQKGLENMSKKKTIIIFAVLLVIGVVAGVLIWQFTKYTLPDDIQRLPVATDSSKQSINANIKVLNEIATDDSVPFLDFENADVLLKNPDRGLRMESYLTVAQTPEAYPGSREDPFKKLTDMIEKYEPDSPTVIQFYIYLTRYSEIDLDQAAFDQIEKYLEICRDNNIRVLMRFTYANESHPDTSYKWVSRHLEQIGEWFDENPELINDTLYCMQGGIVGYWGEGHGNKKLKNKDIGKAFDELVNITPEHVFVQTRTLPLFQKISTENVARLGMHNDYIIGVPVNKWDYFFGKEKNRDIYLNHFKYTINDGEMPWGRALMFDEADGEPLNAIDAKGTIDEIVQQSFTTFSLEHNYREDDSTGKNAPYSMERWKDETITAAELDELGAPYNPNFFENNASMSPYDYIRYHLGYQLAISNVNLNETDNTLTFTINNFGIAAPLNLNELCIVAKTENETVSYQIKEYDKYSLQSGKSLKITITLHDYITLTENTKLGIKLSTLPNSNYNVRFANDTPFDNGVQYIYNY